VAALTRGESYVQDIPSARLTPLTEDERRTTEDHQPSAIGHRLVATTDYGILTQCDAAIIAVPTPLTALRPCDFAQDRRGSGRGGLCGGDGLFEL